MSAVRTETAGNPRLGRNLPPRHADLGSRAPAEALVRLVDQQAVQPGTVLEVGCGTGADAL